MKLIIIVAIVCVCQGQLVLNPDRESNRCLVDQTLYEELQLIKCEMMRMKEQLTQTTESLTEANQNLTKKIDQVDASVDKLQTGENQMNTESLMEVKQSLTDQIELEVLRAKDSLTEKIDQVDASFEELRTGMNEMKTEIMMDVKQSLGDKIDLKVLQAEQRLTEKIDGVDGSVEELQTGVNQMKTDKDSQQKSAFFAHDIKIGYGDDSYSSGDRIIYTSTQINAGGHYNQSTGEYTCPVTGLYYVSYSVYGYWIADGESNSRVTATLMKGGVQQGTVYTSNNNPERLQITLSQSRVLECTAGEKVWVESRGDNNNLYGYNTRNVFSGFLLASV